MKFPILLLLPALAAAAPAKITFSQHIAPIVYQECSPCHRPGESGPFPLLTYDDVKAHATQIADVTKRRFMPPWLPEPGHGEFTEEHRLTDKQIELFATWAAQGALPGPTTNAPKPPAFTADWQLGKPDMILQLPRPYFLAADGPEIFWNFILPVPVNATRWVRAIEVRPGNARAFHHANVIIDRAHGARKLERVPNEGFPGMDIALEEETFEPDSHFLSWKPGSVPLVEPPGMAWRASPGMDLILNVHLKRTGKNEFVTPTIGLYFTDQPQTKFAMLVQMEHDGSLEIPAGATDFIVADDLKMPLDVQVLAVYPHAHYLARVMEAYATLPDGSRKWIIRIPDWDLNWQGVFRFKQPVFLPRGSIVSMRYHYDNSSANIHNPNNPPKPIRAGNTASDEMSHFWLQVLPAGAEDQRAVLQESVMRQRLEKYPTDFNASFNLGDIMLSQGNVADAVAYFQRATAAQPSSVVAATELGVALFMSGKLPDAEKQLKHALELDSKYTDARYNLASVQAAAGAWERAASQFRQVLVERPSDAKSWQHLVEVLALWGDELSKAGDYTRAALRYREAVSYRPDDAELHLGLGLALARSGKIADARTEIQAALKLDPKLEPAQQALAALSQ
jgi:Flp pilus assembly protein TadD